MKKIYRNNRTDETTLQAAEAMAWHRRGDSVYVGHLVEPGKNKNAHYYIVVEGAAQKERNAEEENFDHCKHIAKELDAYVNGEVRRCPDCGEEIRRDWDEVGDAFKCPSCGEIGDPDDWETLGLWDFLEDVYDIEYRVTGRARDALRSVCVMVAYGGPNIYLDTESKNVELYWWGARAWYPMSYEAVAALDEWAEEMWACL